MSYTRTNHSNWSSDQAETLLRGEYENNGYGVDKVHLHKDSSQHEVYALINHPDGFQFMLVVLVEIKSGEIYWKAISEDNGPAYYNCPIQLIACLPATTSDYAIEWRNKCLENSIISA